MKLKHRKPLLWFLVKLLYGADFKSIQAFTFGNTCYSPRPCVNWVLAHEQKHAEQQRHSRVYGLWCFFRYYFDKKYRFQCELEAWQVAVKVGAPKCIAASSLSHKLYGQLVTYEEALKLL